MAIKKAELLVQAIISMNDFDRADIVFGLADVLSRLSEINDEEMISKLENLKKNCHRGLSLDECLEIYNMYKGVNPFVDIYVDGLNIRIRLVDLKSSFRDIYYKILDMVMNIDFGTDYSIGKGSETEDYMKMLREGLDKKTK